MDYFFLILMLGFGVWDLNNCFIYVVIVVYMMRFFGLGVLFFFCLDYVVIDIYRVYLGIICSSMLIYYRKLMFVVLFL